MVMYAGILIFTGCLYLIGFILYATDPDRGKNVTMTNYAIKELERLKREGLPLPK